MLPFNIGKSMLHKKYLIKKYDKMHKMIMLMLHIQMTITTMRIKIMTMMMKIISIIIKIIIPLIIMLTTSMIHDEDNHNSCNIFSYPLKKTKNTYLSVCHVCAYLYLVFPSLSVLYLSSPYPFFLCLSSPYLYDTSHHGGGGGASSSACT